MIWKYKETTSRQFAADDLIITYSSFLFAIIVGSLGHECW